MPGRGRQTALSDLRLSVYARALHPEFFSIRARRDFVTHSFAAQVWLVEGGHVILFVDGPEAVAEVVAPKHLELPERGRVRTLDLVGSDFCRFESHGLVEYQMAYQVEACSPSAYVREAEELLASARRGHLFVEGPSGSAARAFSYAVPEPRGRALVVHAWHGFPAERVILRTQTLIERL